MRPSAVVRRGIPLLTLLATGALAACSSDVVSPTASEPVAAPMAPGASAKSLSGITDGVYFFTVNPRQDQSLALGANVLTIPANSICDLVTSGYGPAYWDKPCTPERSRVVITARVRDAATDHPSIDFYPAMRFNPKNAVTLYFYVPVGMENPTTNWSVLFCDELRLHCVDESLTDPTLAPVVSPELYLVFRRIKHFSGYLISQEGEEGSGEYQPQAY